MIDHEQREPDIPGEESEPENAGGGQIEIENNEDIAGDEDQRRRRRRKPKQPQAQTGDDVAYDPVTLQRRAAYVVTTKKFCAWIKENYPAIRRRTELTPEILAEYDQYDIRTARLSPIEPTPIEAPDPELAEFLEGAFSCDCERSAWPLAFREWVSTKYGIQRRDEVTRAIMMEWREYALAQHDAHDEKADFDYKELDADEFVAGKEQWLHEKRAYFEFLPNTRAEWTDLMLRRACREIDECAEANLIAAQRQKEAAEEQRKSSLVIELKRRELPPVKGRIPKLADLREAREKHGTKKLDLLSTWNARFNDLPKAVQRAWLASYDMQDPGVVDGPYGGPVYLTPKVSLDVDAESADVVLAGLEDPAFAEFRRFSEGVLQALKALDEDLEKVVNPPADGYVPHRGYTLDEIKDEDECYVLAGVIPEGVAVLYGPPKVGKSAWAQKLSACVAGGARFDGAEVAHGRVLYVSCDTGARRGAVKRRLNDIMAQLGLPSTDNLVIVDDSVILNDAISVASLLEQNPGEFALVVIDPLYQCVTGSLMQDAVVTEAVKGLTAISRATGAAILLIHHEPRGSQHLFGSVFLDAALDAQIHVGRDREIVTVKVERLKNGELPTRPFVYRFEGAYLAPAASPTKGAGTETSCTANSRHSEMLALLPDTPSREAEARKLVDHLLSGNGDTRRQQWHRALEAMVKAGLITRRGGMVQRRPPEKP